MQVQNTDICLYFSQNDAKKLYSRLVHLQSDPNKQKYKRSGTFGLFGPKVNLVDHYEKKLEDIEENVRLGQSEGSLAGEVSAEHP